MADACLDRRRPEWATYEDNAHALYVRQAGEPDEQYPLVYVYRECRDVLAVLEPR